MLKSLIAVVDATTEEPLVLKEQRDDELTEIPTPIEPLEQTPIEPVEGPEHQKWQLAKTEFIRRYTQGEPLSPELQTILDASIGPEPSFTD